MTTDEPTPRDAWRGMPAGAPRRRSDPDEWRALGAQLARAGSVSARSAASFTLGFWSEWRKAHPDTSDRLRPADLLDRIAAFTDELTEMLTRDRNLSDGLQQEEPDEPGGDARLTGHADALTLLTDCEQALRAAAATIPASK